MRDGELGSYRVVDSMELWRPYVAARFYVGAPLAAPLTKD
jgi:hypothetical protein